MIFFFNDTATTEIYTLSLHDALPISQCRPLGSDCIHHCSHVVHALLDRKSTRLNSSHSQISYAVFCLKKKKKEINTTKFQFPYHTTKSIIYPIMYFMNIFI